jgi:hypothetical protein
MNVTCRPENDRCRFPIRRSSRQLAGRGVPNPPNLRRSTDAACATKNQGLMCLESASHNQTPAMLALDVLWDGLECPQMVSTDLSGLICKIDFPP